MDKSNENEKVEVNFAAEIKEEAYAEKVAVQLRKGFLVYCVLLVCGQEPVYSSEIIRRLQQSKLIVVEGTLYPLLNRLQKDGLLEHTWQESDQGPPRKYYRITKVGETVKDKLSTHITSLHDSLTVLKKDKK